MYYTPSPSPPATPPTSDSELESATRPKLSYITSSIDPFSTHPNPHPLAASAKADRAPPDYEKKRITPPTTPPESKRNPYLPHGKLRDFDVEPQLQSPTIQRLPSLADEEQKRWDMAISSAVDKAETKLDLSNAGLKYIPSSIIDLKGVVILDHNQQSTSNTTRMFMRSITTPAILPSSNIRPFLPSHSTNRLKFKTTGKRREPVRNPATDRNGCEMQLYLMVNKISILPRELFALDCLVVLSLRQNKLKSLPPAICRLTRLRELNVAGNRLTHLPAEIQDLRLTKLQIYPNPFKAPPLSFGGRQMPNTGRNRTLGPLRRDPSLPTLSEFCLRRLLSPTTSTSFISPACCKSRLEEALSLADIDSLVLPEHIRRTVRASTGHDRARLTEEGTPMDAELDMTMNVCPSPRHHGLVRNGMGSKKSVRFVPDRHQFKKGLFDHTAPVFQVQVEERMEWVGTVAGVQVAENPNAWVPLLWRGCGPGCLDFLEDGEVPEATDECKDTFQAGKSNEDDVFQFSDEE